ncbi:hypothetical protein [Burkholderia sp. TSV86]|uniref:hypothetical protein n=1 Tax=Burkholderia sp. TSV86 TaxID=1385594 RepID=UPI000AC58E42|nr:hypothetical protein [Burkholderia sp. TSV86]
MNVSTESARMRLPRSVQEIADVIGCERALYLIGQLPRCITRDRRYPNATASHVVLYVPTAARLPLDHDLVRILGWNDAVKLCRVFGGEILQPASCAEIYRRYRDAEIVRMKSAGVRTQYIASVFGVTEQTVRFVFRAGKNPQEELPKAANDNAPIEDQGRINGPTRANAVADGKANRRTGRARRIELG